ncbi:uncharacterized protein [Rutidosis leptorrhynchoides]|uniref:uncharacterized protein n=1 Tax=Rutidosis leptorrhynchoides TaxID=125765 RepID=UPI003A98E210
MALESLVSSFVFNNSGVDTCSWSLSNNGIFSVRSLSLIIDNNILGEVINANAFETMKNNLVPKKIELFVWRAVQKRLPVRIELDKRGIDLNSVRCSLCDDDLESVDHSLIFCKNAMDVWDRVFAWWDLGSMTNLSINELLRGHGPSSPTSFGSKLWQAVEWVSAYLIWRNRNEKVFRDKCWNPHMALNEIQVKTFEWISKRSRKRKLDWLTWLNDPRSYLRLA